jgi:hypothetical protein
MAAVIAIAIVVVVVVVMAFVSALESWDKLSF